MEYVQTSIGIVEIIHLMREAFLLLKGYQFMTNDQDACVRDHLRSVSARLGHFHSRYRKISNIRCTKSPNLNVSRLVLQLPLPNPMKLGFKSRMKM